MKVRPSVRVRCEKCKIIKRRGIVRIICTNPRHKQRQGWGSGQSPVGSWQSWKTLRRATGHRPL